MAAKTSYVTFRNNAYANYRENGAAKIFFFHQKMRN